MNTLSIDLSYLKKKKVALALSGGRDSMALAHLLLGADVDFYCVHFEHGIRGESSIRDCKFVEEWGRNHGVEVRVIPLDCPKYAKDNGLTLEQGARELRYAHFDDMLKNGECDYVALAHHASDQTETVFMRILRGTGVAGLKGMSVINGGYVRPMLNVTRAEIDDFVKENGIPYVDDETNSDTSYTRNFLRAELCKMRERFPSLDETVARLTRNAAEIDDFLSSLIPPVEVKDGEVRMAVADMDGGLLAKRRIKAICDALGVRQDFEERHYPLVFSLASAENGKMLCLPHGLTAHKDGEYVVFALEKDNDNFEIPFDGESVDGIIKCEKADGYHAGSGALYIDLDRIPQGAVLRRIKDGDKIKKFGGGTKNLGDFLTDKKYPLRKRKDLVVCAVGSDVLFVLGVEISAQVAVEDSSVRVLKISQDKYELN